MKIASRWFHYTEIIKLQQTALLGTSHIIRKVLQCETSLSGGGHRWFKRSTGEKRPVTRYSNNDDDDNNNNFYTFLKFHKL
jgi:hypothetical protein